MCGSKFGIRWMCGLCLQTVALLIVASIAYTTLTLIVQTARSASDQSKLIACFDIFFLISAALCLLYCAAGIFAEIFLSIRDCAGDVMALLFTKNKIAPSPSPPSTVVQDGAPPPPPPPDHDHLPV